jgi:hypothetical protein
LLTLKGISKHYGFANRKRNKKIENGLEERPVATDKSQELVLTTTAGMHSATTTHSLQS